VGVTCSNWVIKQAFHLQNAQYSVSQFWQHFNTVLQHQKFMRSLIHYAADQEKTNTEFDAVPVCQILMYAAKLNRFTKYCVLYKTESLVQK